MNLGIEDKTAMVCASTSGVGKAGAEALLAGGMGVVMKALRAICITPWVE